MGIFELERLRAEGKGVIFPDGSRAIDIEETKLFEEADKRIDEFYKEKQFNKLLEDTEIGIPMRPRFLGC